MDPKAQTEAPETMTDTTHLEGVIPADPTGLAIHMYPPAAVVATSMEEQGLETQVCLVLQDHLAVILVRPLLTKMEVIEDPPLLTLAADMDPRIEIIITILQALQTITIQVQEIGEIGIGKEIVNTPIKEMIRMKGEVEASMTSLGTAIMVVVALI